jgi:hypothetical protein
LWCPLAGKFGGFDFNLGAKDFAVAAFVVNALVKGEVIKPLPEGAEGGMVG